MNPRPFIDPTYIHVFNIPFASFREAAYVSEIFCSPFSDYGLLSMVDPLTNGYYFFKGNLLIHKKGKLEINKKLHILIDLGHAKNFTLK